MPTSVLLAVLAAAGLLALAPALVRRYDATERLVAERAQSTARVLERRRRRRTVPGPRPIRAGRALVVTLRASAPASGIPVSALPVSGAPVSGVPVSGAPVSGVPGRRPSRLRSVPRQARRPRRRPPVRRHTPAVYRRRRVLAALLLLNLVELVGVVVVGPGFWIGVSVTATLLGVYVVHLRNRAIEERRRRRLEAREAAWLAARQAEVRREQARRAASRREHQRRLAAQREAVRRAAMGVDGSLPAASVSYRRAGGLRGRAYEAGRPGAAHSA
ncbi:divisome protein SepX/GlpR [Micromonospora sp. CPCC 206061]|uniref:divisome protein SepX/GlpR n=1 Tax=Micromonospora sp. CPCC 206061 TaxID=3122410 RepID=UPI002FF0E9DC